MSGDSVAQRGSHDVELESAELARQERSRCLNRLPDFGQGEGCFVGVSTRPQLNNKHHVGFLVVDAHLVGQTAHRFERIAAPGEEHDQFVAFAGKSSEGTYVGESHPSELLSSRVLSRAGAEWMPGQNGFVMAKHHSKDTYE